MKIRHLYAALCVPGALLPWWQFLPWLSEHGADLPLFFGHLFANGVSGAFGLDLIVTALVICCLIVVEGRRVGVRHLWVPVLATFLIAVSLGLPLFLYLRERALEENEASARGPR